MTSTIEIGVMDARLDDLMYQLELHGSGNPSRFFEKANMLLPQLREHIKQLEEALQEATVVDRDEQHDPDPYEMGSDA